MSMNPAPSSADTEEYSLPCAEALLAGTLALMTGYAQGSSDSHRDAMGRKIVANLQNLSQLDALTPHFRTMLWNLQVRWATQAVKQAAAQEDEEVRAQPADPGRALWHAAPESLQ